MLCRCSKPKYIRWSNWQKILINAQNLTELTFCNVSAFILFVNFIRVCEAIFQFNCAYDIERKFFGSCCQGQSDAMVVIYRPEISLLMTSLGMSNSLVRIASVALRRDDFRSLKYLDVVNWIFWSCERLAIGLSPSIELSCSTVIAVPPSFNVHLAITMPERGVVKSLKRINLNPAHPINRLCFYRKKTPA